MTKEKVSEDDMRECLAPWSEWAWVFRCRVWVEGSGFSDVGILGLGTQAWRFREGFRLEAFQ